MGDPTAWDRAAKEYAPLMEVIAESLSPGFTAQAVERRRNIARLLPDMKSEAKRLGAG